MHKLLWTLAFACCIHISLSACVNGFYNGLPCASTTRYTCDSEGACGAGDNNANTPFSWQTTLYTAAGSQGFFNPANQSVGWCGSGCGACYLITPTGDCPTGGDCVKTQTSIVIMVTNLCPYNGNEVWCPQPGGTNNYGFHYHFDLMDNNNAIITPLGWDNPAVTWVQVPCDGHSMTPTCADVAQSNCASVMSTQCKAGTMPAGTTAATTAAATTAASSVTHATIVSHATTATTAATSATHATTATSATHATTTTTATHATTTSATHATTATAATATTRAPTTTTGGGGSAKFAVTVTFTGKCTDFAHYFNAATMATLNITELSCNDTGTPTVVTLQVVASASESDSAVSAYVSSQLGTAGLSGYTVTNVQHTGTGSCTSSGGLSCPCKVATDCNKGLTCANNLCVDPGDAVKNSASLSTYSLFSFFVLFVFCIIF